MRCQIFHMSGPYRGRTVNFGKRLLRLGTAPEADLRYPEGWGVAPRHAEIRWMEEGCAFTLEAGEAEVLVNGQPVTEVVLQHEDLVALGPKGPKLRFRIPAEGRRPCKPVRMILRDARDVRGHHGVLASTRALGTDLLVHSSWRTRILLLLLVGAVVFGMAYLGGRLGGGRRAAEQEARHVERVELYQRELEAVRAELDAFRRQQSGYVSREEVADLRQELDRRAEVVDRIVRRSAALRQVLDVYSRGVCLFYGVFTLEAERDGRRIPVTGPDGSPLELEYIGSGFLATAEGHVITNRHVAEPWWNNAELAPLLARGFEARFVRLVAVFPDHPPLPVDVSTIRLSPEDVDVALLQVAVTDVPVLPLSRAEAGASRGEKVILIGYPGGLNSVLARLEPEEFEELRQTVRDTPGLIEELARRGHIRPVITQGALNEVTARRLVYDAGTTSGGSGGPVFGPDGTAIGVNFAVTREFHASNFGVPIRFARDLLP